jgi:hypothetical protein
MNVVSMSSDRLSLRPNSPPRSDRHFLPGDGQKIPYKLLKNNENTPPEFFGRGVQGSEAVCNVHIRHCGLEIGNELRA